MANFLMAKKLFSIKELFSHVLLPYIYVLLLLPNYFSGRGF